MILSLASVSTALAEAVPRGNGPDGNLRSCDTNFRNVITSGIEGEMGQNQGQAWGTSAIGVTFSFWGQIHTHTYISLYLFIIPKCLDEKI